MSTTIDTTTATTETEPTAGDVEETRASADARSPLAKAQPAAKIRMGVVTVSIWRNLDQDGRAWYSATVERSYKDKNDQWKHTNSFGRNEMLVVAKIANLAHSKIHELESRDRAAAAYDESSFAKTPVAAAPGRERA